MAPIIFEIYRYNPEKDKEPYYKKYAVEIARGTTVSMVLRKIKDKADGSLTFRKGCGSAICGTCALRVNEKAVLACRTKIEDVVGDLEQASADKDVVKIDPLDNAQVVKDLVVAEDVFWNKLKQAMPWLNAEMTGEISELSKKDIDAMENAQDCIHCHACQSGCDTYEVDEGFLGAEVMNKIYRFVMDPRDRISHQRLQMANDGGLWNCVRAYSCIDACPKDIKPADKISKLHELGIDAGLTGKGARHAKHFVHGLRKTGKLDEMMMPLKTMGFGVLGFVPDTIKMVSKGKMPHIFNKKIEGQKEVWHLVELSKDKKEVDE
ncbi:succinate dehydrogenase/fumarate reductase iron-sulfur subunit [Nanoarchaeota archaeon]